ncbi:MAG: hypothetical protein HY879_05805 [Deltaproteobacteria bacterium]|nr:hypothetical protein [Deltaproteobacteria bacterium]
MRDGFSWAIGGQLTGAVAGEVTGVVQRLLMIAMPGKPTSSKQKIPAHPKRPRIAKLLKEAKGGEK